MNVIACAGYHTTGSGIIDDYFREFRGFAQSASHKECRLLQDPDGVSDLEYNLIENPHRLNSGYALKRFRIMCQQYKRVYKFILGKDYMRYIDDYIKDLTKFEYYGYWFGDIWLQKPFKRYAYWAKRVLNKMLPKKIRRNPWYNYFPKIKTYHCPISEEEFLEKTKKFVDRICAVIGGDAEYVLLDQLVPVSNLPRYMRYVNDLKVIIVDRDPRDLYIQLMRLHEHTLPKDPKLFCEVYRDNRQDKTADFDAARVLKITMEELIYNYSEATERVRNFVGVSEEYHIKKLQYFDPSKSIKNTKLWEKYPEYQEAVKIIEKELPEYLSKY